MNVGALTRAIASVFLGLSLTGCRGAPGKPHLEVATLRPDQVLDFPTLYSQNCAACHGAQGRQGAAISLANPVYLATAGIDNLHQAIANGLPRTLMPAFAKSQGGLLTDAQVNLLSRGIMQTWGTSSAGLETLPYAAHTAVDPAQGRVAYTMFCASCHGAGGAGAGPVGSIVDPTYLELMSDQGLRSTILGGMPGQGMPDWRSDSATRAMTDQEVTDTVGWIATHRTPAPYPTSALLAPRRTTHE
jgi:mono/diheme cytochrome c family protein